MKKKVLPNLAILTANDKQTTTRAFYLLCFASVNKQRINLVKVYASYCVLKVVSHSIVLHMYIYAVYTPSVSTLNEKRFHLRMMYTSWCLLSTNE